MQSSSGRVLSLGRSTTLQMHLKPTASIGILGYGNYNGGNNILNHPLSTSISNPVDAEGSGTAPGFFNSFFGKSKMELQHAPHKQVDTVVCLRGTRYLTKVPKINIFHRNQNI